MTSRVLQRLITWYQHLFSGRPSPCRYQPTCSSYALEAIQVHGAGRGSWLAVRRLSRCHPFGSHGWDPVPLPRNTGDPQDPNPARQHTGHHQVGHHHASPSVVDRSA